MEVIEIDCLPLTSTRWAGLKHAFGAATDTPTQLSRAAQGDRDALSELWGTICHQGSVYGASYAAFPHLVRIASAQPDQNVRAELLVLAGCIHVGGQELSAQEEDIRRWYQSAIPTALALAHTTLDTDLEPSIPIHLLEAVAGFAGYRALALILEGFVDQEFAPVCPSCDRELYVWPDGDGLKVAADDPVTNKTVPFEPVRGGLAKGSRFAAEHSWLREQCTSHGALRSMANRVDALFGTVICPSCGAEFALIDTLAEQLS